MKVLIQKFGGTSLESLEARKKAVDRIENARASGFQIAAVFSAMGRSPSPYATDTLLNLLHPDSPSFLRDLLSSCGEVISCAVMGDLLEQRGISCEIFPFDRVGILTDNQHENAEILEVNTAPILNALEKSKVAVIPGFQGIGTNGKMTTLGRGGSDITACALGAVLNAERVEIYKDVQGVFSADPKVVPKAQILPEISYQEVGEMAYQGAKVLHPKAVSFAMEGKIPIRVLSHFEDHPGTEIKAESNKLTHSIIGIAHIPGMSYVQVKMREDLEKVRYNLFQSFAENGISLDLITVDQEGVYFIVEESKTIVAKKLLSDNHWNFTIEDGFAKVSVVGAGMRGKPGVMFRVVDALYRAGIKLYHSTDSHITIACLVKEYDMEKAVRALHEKFLQN